MRSLGLAVSRMAAAGWLGAAALFVVTALREVRNPDFDASMKDTLALLRFPAYYAFGLTLLVVALAGALLALAARPSMSDNLEKWKIRAAIGLLAAALLLLIGDYVAVYQPIVGMITPPGSVRTAEFQAYHRASVSLNVCGLASCAAAALMLCWPEREGRNEMSPSPVTDHARPDTPLRTDDQL